MEPDLAEISSKKKLTRRDFLKLSTAAIGGLVFNSVLGEWWSERKPDLEKFDNVVAEYKLGWMARPWVWVNLAIASQRLDGLTIKPGEELSIVKAMGLDKTENLSDQNTDPRKGYIAAQMSDFKELSGLGYGLCLASTTIFRSALYSPLRITDRGTHYDRYEDYFRDFPPGTDAAVFYPGSNDKLPETDLRLMNPTDKVMTLRYRVYNADGTILRPPQQEIPITEYKASYLDQLVRILQKKYKSLTGMDMPEQYFPQLIFGNRKIISRAVITTNEKVNYRVTMSGVSMLPGSDGPNANYQFSRQLDIIKGIADTKYKEDFISQYGKSPVANVVPSNAGG